MKPRTLLLFVLVLSVFTCGAAVAQPFGGAFLGFKASGLEGVMKLTTQAGTQTGNVVDAGSTGFTFGITGGYQIFPKDFADGWYKLDLTLDASFTSIAYFEEGYNKQFGAGAFAANGLSGGSTTIIALDIMPINRLTFPKFKLLSPYIGIGLGLNIMSTGDITTGPPSANGTLEGVGEFKIGLLIFYGCLVHLSDLIQPYLQFKHMIPFGDETQFTDNFQATGGTGGGNQKYAFYIQDVPGYFAMTAGVRFTF